MHRLARLLMAGIIAASTILLFGCHHGQPEPSAPGYYTGDLKPKGVGSGAGQTEGAPNKNGGSGAQAGAPP